MEKCERIAALRTLKSVRPSPNYLPVEAGVNGLCFWTARSRVLTSKSKTESFRACNNVHVAQRGSSCVGDIVLGVGWTVEGMIGLEVEL